MEALLNKGANIDARNENGGTPLGLAAFNGHKEIVELLIARDANVNVQNDFGMTSLHVAVFGVMPQHWIFCLDKTLMLTADIRCQARRPYTVRSSTRMPNWSENFLPVALIHRRKIAIEIRRVPLLRTEPWTRLSRYCDGINRSSVVLLARIIGRLQWWASASSLKGGWTDHTPWLRLASGKKVTTPPKEILNAIELVR